MDKQIAITLTFRDQASGAATKAVGALSGAFKGLATTGVATTATVTSAFGTMVGKVGGFIGRLIKSSQLASLFIGGTFVAAMGSAIDMAAKFERFGKAAEFMTGSTDAANKFAEAVREVSLQTMFNVDEIAEMESRLVGNTRNVDQSTTALKALTEAVAATGGAFPELEGATRAWIQVNSKAKVSSEELNRQFANANIPIVRLLAESIEKDLNHPLRQYLSIASSGVGVSKKLATAYEGATDKTKYLGEEIRIAEAKLKSYEGNSKIAGTTVDSLKLSILKKKDALGKANATIGEYTEAQKKATGATKGTKISVEEIMAQLQEVGDFDIPGSIGAAAITRALEEAYGGANQKLLQTFSGQMSLVKDALKLMVLSFVGLDKNFKVVEGGIIDLLTKALRPLAQWLQDHQEDVVNFGQKLGKSLPFLLAIAGVIGGVLLSALLFIVGPIIVLGAVFGGIGAIIGFVIEKLGGFKNIIETIKGIIDTVRDALSFLSEKFTEIKDKIENEVNKKLEELHEWYKKHEVAILILTSIITAFFLPALAMVAVKAGLAAAAFFTRLIPALIQLGIHFFLTSVGAMAAFIWRLGVIIISAGTHAVFALINLTIATIQFGIAAWKAVFFLMTWIIQLTILTVQQLIQIAVTTVLTVVTWAQVAATWALNAALAVLTSPIFLIILAIIVLVAIGWWLMTHWDTVKAKAIEIWSSIKQWISDTVEGSKIIIKEKWEAIKKWLSDTWEGIKTSAGSAWKGISDAIIGPIKNVIDWLDKAVNKAGELIGKAAEATKKGIKISGLWGGQHGGIVPGPVGAAVPIIAHGGERITPRGSNTNAPFANQGGGGTTINFYGNMTVDSEDRVKQLADTIARMLGRQNELAKWGMI